MSLRFHHLPVAICVILAVGTLTTLSSCGSAGPPQQAAANQGVAQLAAGPAAGEPATTAAPAPAPEPVLLAAAELADGWISLFDGQTLFGWKAGSQADWRVEDGAILVGSGEKGLLYTTTQFGDYVLRVDFRSEPGTNSGIFLHTPPQPLDPAADCYELNIAEADNPFPTGSLVHRQKAEVAAPSGQWHTFEATLDGDRVAIKVNDQPVLDYTDPKPLRRGHIGLQLNSGKVAFRNIRLKPLGMASKFTVTGAGELHVENGRGQLETEKQYGDFALQLECQTLAPRLNSGVFFRCIPGEQMNGYECQIHNGFENDDRTQPQDCGTGGFFRRQSARRVVADDLAWFPMTLVADGPHMAAWVNGYQVSDWTDDRPADANPRKGLRLEPGTIMIQGHDPTTNISFRKLRIAEWGPRAQVGQ